MDDDLERIKRLLWEEWDPIGVNDYEDARGEYDRYASQVLRLAQGGASVEAIAAYLEDIEVERIGLRANPARNHKVAIKARALLDHPT